MNLRIYAVSVSLLLVSQTSLTAMSKTTKLFKLKHVTKYVNVYYATSKLHYKNICSFDNPNNRPYFGTVISEDLSNVSPAFSENILSGEDLSNVLPVFANGLPVHQKKVCLPDIEEMPQEMQAWYARRSKKLHMGILEYFEYRDKIHDCLKHIEFQRNKIFRDIAQGKLVDFSSGTYQEQGGSLEQWESLFKKVLVDSCSCAVRAKQNDPRFSFNYFTADELIKLINACDDGDCQKK